MTDDAMPDAVHGGSESGTSSWSVEEMLLAGEGASTTSWEGITFITLPAGEHISQELAEVKAAEARALAAGVPRPLLIDISGVRSIDRDARAVLGDAQMSTAVALVGSGPVDRVLGNFVLGGQRPACPVTFFASKAEAIAWLASFLPVP
jgi:hypothetical protein